MYTKFFGLKEKPFNLTPSPRFLYLSEGHKEALALLKYGVLDRKGFILLTGEVGTGKTTMVRTLLHSLNSTVRYVLLSNPLLSPNDFIDYLALSIFKKKVHFHSKAHFLLVLEPYLKKALNNHENLNLIIDEAHKLSFELLEEIRLLSNMETGEEKLITIFLVGQPELNKKLSDPRCRPLLQRISIRHNIPPLNLEETRDYMDTRLKVAGAEKPDQIFSKSAVEAIYHFAGGYPREINVLSDNALLLGYSRGTKKITASMVGECYDDLQLSDVGRVGPAAKRVENEAELVETRLEQVESVKTSRFWKWAAVLFIFVVLSAVALSPHGKKIISKVSTFVISTYSDAINDIRGRPVSARNRVDRGVSNRPERRKPVLQTVMPPITTDKGLEKIDSKEPAIEPITGKKTDETTLTSTAYSTSEEKNLPQLKKKELSKTLIVKQGDTLSKLAVGIYGYFDDNILAMIQKANPYLEDINRIDVGQKIVFPPIVENAGNGRRITEGR